MTKRVLMLLALVLALALVACGGQEAVEQPTLEPAEAPTDAPPTAEPEPTAVVETSIVESREHVPDPELIDVTWEWTRRDPNGNQIDEIVVPNPEKYTLYFNEDGLFNATIDCNSGAGLYATSGTGGIFMELGPVTRVACPPESLSESMIQMFGPAQSYRFEDEGQTLVMSWAAGGPVDYFRRAADSMEMESAQSLTGQTWQWQGTVTPVEEITVADPSRYTITFNEDGTANIVADCNNVGATYTTDGSSLSIELGPSTLALCPPDSQDTQFTTQLAAAAIYFFQDGDLFIDLFADGGTMRFATAAEPTLTGQTWLWQGTVTPVEEISVADPTRYTITFNDDGTAEVLADCNGVGAEYTTDGSSISIELGFGTLIACPEDTQDTLFKEQLSAAAIYFFQDGDLFIDLFADGGTMRFATASEPKLTGETWQWLGTVTPVEEITAADPTRYNIVFNADGTANIKADCNSVLAEYTTDGSVIAITPGPTTLVACPPDSQDQLYLQQLSAAAIYFFQDGDLYIDLFADAGTMRFTASEIVDLPEPAPGDATGTVTAPDGIFLRTGPSTQYPYVGTAAQGDTGKLIGVSEDGQWYVIEAPDLPDGQVWGAAAFIEATGAEGLPVVPAPALGGTLIGVNWAWMSLTDPNNVTTIDEPLRYTILFGADGSALINADCNTVRGSYTAGADGTISISTLGPSTLVACPPDSLDQAFLQNLSEAVIYFTDGGELFLDKFADAGTMRFAPASSVGAPPVGEPTGPVTLTAVSFGPLGAAQPVLAGTTITAMFDLTANTVAGNAGCNSYSATLTPVDDHFTVGPIATTLQLCTEPAGIMEQEQAYLSALQSTSGYRWEQQMVGGNNVVTAGQIIYTLADGTVGEINYISP